MKRGSYDSKFKAMAALINYKNLTQTILYRTACIKVIIMQKKAGNLFIKCSAGLVYYSDNIRLINILFI